MTTAVPVPAPVPASSSRMALAPISNSKLNSNSNVKSNGHLKPFASSTPFLKRSITLDMNLLPSLKRRLSNSGKEMGMGKHVLQNFNYSTSLTAAAMSAAAYPSPIPTPTIGENLENLERSEKLEKLEKKLNHAELLKTRLRLAYYKIKSNQVDTPISKIVDTSREFTKTPLIKRAQTLEMLLASSTPLINSMQYPLPTSIPPHHPILKKNYNSTRKKSSNFKNIKNIKKKIYKNQN
ncbi:hypothetical protein PACTADRAFT_35273 [Pachysolen tannophilus NRRL Y-2460]|uniref:Uncharacterized protein n=1 Tax=Pachysolen tannophilus NRRL Y-2460 TaxID=669874 RepID=A0A1E4TRT5_PACTA|nr:hypothetical protein PACTADRAFT_35273 [Pachysolen tannophilus NRRL Y-2460]